MFEKSPGINNKLSLNIVGVPKFNLVPKLNFISDDSIKDKIVSWQETVGASISSNPAEGTSDKQDEDSKKKSDISDSKTDIVKDQNESKGYVFLKGNGSQIFLSLI